MARPKILITIQGGLIQSITADADITVGIIDYDEMGYARVTSPDDVREFNPDLFKPTSARERRAKNHLTRAGFYE